ncbi:transcriptional regulator, AbrB family [[Clostridium] methylpentosum DSM 5476]|jgi:AbrB family transcriptional regulator, transcriptional pleiotropic regulator of transition state genes|uniref:Transcriptional regulator, AbrB family n=1 Tax=[Clostridium] methylpentosum DSM 5476 TaxID=537013 RepID=C0EDM4_9FIRM|nr:transcriptional regulator, AbrB family [[Clostridium] methylpentosum DSM 5476]MDY3989171.1 AbrB/MazE/SpoVT family DNA-binding domain-containing protein [Massilioclostridium sp.]MEE1492968.1 AbrB/MazE/SpoVT family DNA-binding domain-containing protein [Massilioclostridium sp.]
MKSTGIVRNTDKVGRIVLPIELRQSLYIDEGDALEIYTEDDKIILKKYNPTCIFCGSADDMDYFKGKFVCAQCKVALSNR